MNYLLLLFVAGFELYNVNGRSLTLRGFTQVYYSYSSQSTNTFSLRRSRVIFFMRQSSNLTFKMQLDFLKSPALLDAKMQYRRGNFMFQLGRFLPDFTFYMPHSSTSLDFVYYPLMCEKYGMWRQVGLEGAYFISKNLYLKGGIYNGPKNNYRDVNGTKDALFKAGYDGNIQKTGLYVYLKRDREDRRTFLSGFYFDVRPNRFIFTVEPLYVKNDSINSLSFYAQAGYFVLENTKMLARVDVDIPDVDSTDSRATRLSAGVVRELNDHLKLYLDFVRNLEADSNEAILQLQCVW